MATRNTISRITSRIDELTERTYSTKMVDGNSVPLSAEEIAELERRDCLRAGGASDETPHTSEQQQIPD